MPKDNEVDEKAVLWRAPHGSGKWMHFEHEPKHLKSYEPLYSAATVAELRAEVVKERERAEKFMWQVRDTCARAEAAERRVGELEKALSACNALSAARLMKILELQS